MEVIRALNIAIFNFLFSVSGHAAWVDWLIVAVAEYLPWGVVAVVLYYAYRAWQKKLKSEVWGYVLAFASGGIARGITEIIRFYYHHPRPSLVLDILSLFPELSYSFPSAHAVFLFGLSMGVYLTNKKLGRILLITAAIVGISRIIAGVHWPSDIFIGALLGILTAWVVFKIAKCFPHIP